MAISKADQVLLDSAKDLGTTWEDLNGDVKNMRNQLMNLQAQWIGRGGTAFQGAINAWQTHADKVLRTMQDFKEQLIQTEDTYTVTEERVENVFNKYAGGLG